MKTYIKKDILHDTNIDNYTMATYIALRSLFVTHRSIEYVTDNMLCYELCGHTSYTKYMRQAINKGINTLAELGYITILEKVGKSDFVIDMESLFFDGNEVFYVILDNKEIHTIFEIEGNTDKFALLRYFACMIGTINGSYYVYNEEHEPVYNIVGDRPIKTICSMAGIPEKTGISYNALLENIGLIYIYRHEKYNVDGEIKTLNNHYGRRCDGRYIKQFALEYEEKTGQGKTVIKAKKDANERRSLTQKYNAFVNGTEYSEDEVFDIFQAVLNHNAKCQNIIDGCLNEEAVANAKKELKDITIFEEYYGVGLEEMFNG